MSNDYESNFDARAAAPMPGDEGQSSGRSRGDSSSRPLGGDSLELDASVARSDERAASDSDEVIPGLPDNSFRPRARVPSGLARYETQDLDQTTPDPVPMYASAPTAPSDWTPRVARSRPKRGQVQASGYEGDDSDFDPNEASDFDTRDTENDVLQDADIYQPTHHRGLAASSEPDPAQFAYDSDAGDGPADGATDSSVPARYTVNQSLRSRRSPGQRSNVSQNVDPATSFSDTDYETAPDRSAAAPSQSSSGPGVDGGVTSYSDTDYDEPALGQRQVRAGGAGDDVEPTKQVGSSTRRAALDADTDEEEQYPQSKAYGELAGRAGQVGPQNSEDAAGLSDDERVADGQPASAYDSQDRDRGRDDGNLVSHTVARRKQNLIFNLSRTVSEPSRRRPRC